MKAGKLPYLLAAALLVALSQSGEASTDCPRSVGTDTQYVDAWVHASTWFGTKDMAVILPEDGVWPTTVPGHSISVKLFWFIDGFESGQEGEFVGSIRRLDEGKNDAVISEPTNAGGPSLGAWTVLTGIDFPSAGCWEVSGQFRGRVLTFVVETISHTNWR